MSTVDFVSTTTTVTTKSAIMFYIQYGIINNDTIYMKISGKLIISIKKMKK